VRFDLLLADENAKANVNIIYERRDLTYLYQAVQRMSGARVRVPVHLRPTTPREHEPSQPAFRSWGQIFATTSNEARQMDVAVALNEASRQSTCWGNGRLHFAVASDESVREVAGLAVSDLKVSQLLRLRREQPGRDLQSLLLELDLIPSQRSELQELLTDNSMCQSLWLTASVAASREMTLVVRETDLEGEIQVSVWEW
jgi:hypothetical protein